ncbi:MAG: hypothetical protein TREMPRED_000399 [Tremellales sp. Tagirdzhanova-0007]|nr:MAG: hypothetical protein TREMPRED_000399 [Tremellales sp. Tagirdzhanova-0007]
MPVYTLDLRNHGSSPHAEPHTYEAMAGDLACFFRSQKLSSGINLLGHSMGGKVVMAFALDEDMRSPLRSLISVDMSPAVGKISREFLEYTQAMLKIEQARVKTKAEADKILQEVEPNLSTRQFLLTNTKTSLGTDSHLTFRIPLSLLSASIPSIGNFPYTAPPPITPKSPQWCGPTLFIKGERSRYLNPRTAHFGRECTEHIISALKTGYTYLDGAQQYRNAKSIGEALKQWTGKREDLFVLTKFGSDNLENDPRKALKELMDEMGVSYVDMYLIHNPLYSKPRPLSEVWKDMESLQKEGLCKSIGVSNFREEDLLEIKDHWTIPPAVNQIEYHPYVYHAANVQRLVKLCKEHRIALQCYGPLQSLVRFTGGPIDPVVEKIAKEKSVTTSQVLIAWTAQHSGGITVTTSKNAPRQEEQLNALREMSPLSEDQVNEIAEAGKGMFSRHFQRKVWDQAEP